LAAKGPGKNLDKTKGIKSSSVDLEVEADYSYCFRKAE